MTEGIPWTWQRACSVIASYKVQHLNCLHGQLKDDQVYPCYIPMGSFLEILTKGLRARWEDGLEHGKLGSMEVLVSGKVYQNCSNCCNYAYKFIFHECWLTQVKHSKLWFWDTSLRFEVWVGKLRHRQILSNSTGTWILDSIEMRNEHEKQINVRIIILRNL